MRRKWLIPVLTLMVTLASLLVQTPVRAEAHHQAMVRVVHNKKTVKLSAEPILINQTPYLPLRDVCDLLGGRVSWNEESREAGIRYQKKNYSVQGLIRNNRMMIDMDETARIFNINVAYDPVMSAVMIDRGHHPTREQLLGILPNFDGYDRDDLYWMSRIVEAEANGESYESRLAVANVIINRLNDGSYPNTVKEVIFDSKFGVQFTPTANGSVYNEPSTLSMLAAMDALEGRNNASGALFFMNPKYATSFWMQHNRDYAFTIGGHRYYY